MGWAYKAAIGVVVAAVVVAYNYHGMTNMTDHSQQIYLRLYGSSIYEYHALTGNWPANVDDLARTSLPSQNRHWKSQIDIGADVVVWPKQMNPDSKSNGQVLLAYHNKGLDVERGRIWVCWGDLRTECISPNELQEALRDR